MSTAAPLQTAAAKPLQSAGASLVLQRKCACGASASGLTGECEECSKKKIVGLQTKLRVNEPGDAHEQEADRVAEQVLAKPLHPDVSSAPPRIQRFSGQSSGQIGAAPPSVDRALASPGRPLEPALRHDMEQRFGHDFSRVRVHTGGAAEQSARELNAHAYTAGHNIVFGAGRFAPETHRGQRLIAHELTHVVQQSGADGLKVGPLGDRQRQIGQVYPSNLSIQRDSVQSPVEPSAEQLVGQHWLEMVGGHFDGLVGELHEYVKNHTSPYDFIGQVLDEVGTEWDHHVAAALVAKLSWSRLNEWAATRDGRATLSVLYAAIITGNVEREREQADRILLVKARQYRPEDYVRWSKERPPGDYPGQKGKPTLIFPIRFMGSPLDVVPGSNDALLGSLVSSGASSASMAAGRATKEEKPARFRGPGIFGDYATPLAQLTEDGKVRVKYPVAVKHMSTFKEEVRTLPDGFFHGEGEKLNPNEIVGIKDYERGETLYLPALVLIDYSNQAIHSTAGKVKDVSEIVATFGAVAAEEAIGELTAARWGARLAKGMRALDRVANFIGVASSVIVENQDWIVSKFGDAGRKLVKYAHIANSVASIYGIVSLAAGHTIVKEMGAASKAARAQAGAEAEARFMQRLDDETDAMLKELDEEAAKSGRGAATVEQKPSSAEKPVGAAEEIYASATAHKLSPTKLEAEVSELERKAVNPDNVLRPSDPKLDAEMTADGHTFERSKASRTWCRESEKKCDLNLGKNLNTKTDAAVAKRDAKYAELEKQRKAREAAPTRAREPKKEPARKPSTDQPPEKGLRPAEEVKESPQAKIDPKDPEALVKKSARDRAREETQKKIKEIKKQKERAYSKIAKLKKQIDDLNAKIKRLKEELRNTADPQQANALEKKIQAAEYKLNEEKGGGLVAEREGTIEELRELEKKRANLTEALKLERPSLREPTKRKIEAKADREKTPPYRFLDRDNRPIDGPIHYGHRYGREHRRLALEAQELGMNQAQFNDWVNNHPEWFQIESAEENLSHQHEKRGID